MRNPKCERQFINGNCGAIVVCLCDLCHVESLCVALEAVKVSPWTTLLGSIHWLYVYLLMAQVSVLIHLIGLKVWHESLYCMLFDMAAPQCRQRCQPNTCDHPIDDCLV